jgi:hypothetical protein
MLDEIFHQLLGLPYPDKKKKQPHKRSKKKKTYRPYEGSYSHKLDIKMRKDLEKSYGRVTTDMMDEYKED